MLTWEHISNPCSTGYTRKKGEKEVMAVHAPLYGMEWNVGQRPDVNRGLQVYVVTLKSHQ
jgi:hypothetical protein